jgi:hypothetical protein
MIFTPHPFPLPEGERIKVGGEVINNMKGGF